MTVKLIDHNRDNENEYETRAEAEEQRDELISLGASPKDLEIVATTGAEESAKADGGQGATVVETPNQDPREPEVTNPEELSKNPIQFLERVNESFVNRIRGKPAISKQGFRFIQREFEISTESEVVEWSEDPLGCVVWAKAELPNGYSAEAHGEGYQFESDVSDNEFVRYADTRAKNRAISDLTSAGALAVSELQGND